MLAILNSLRMFIVDLFKSRYRIEAENLFLRHQLNIALRAAPPRLRLRDSDPTVMCEDRALPLLATACARPNPCMVTYPRCCAADRRDRPTDMQSARVL